MKKLEKNEVLWLFAIRDHTEIEHYQSYYTLNHIPSKKTLVDIVYPIIEDMGEIQYMMRLLRLEATMIQMLKNKKELSLSEWLWEGIKHFTHYITVKDLDKNCGGKHWHKWIDEEREKSLALENEIESKISKESIEQKAKDIIKQANKKALEFNDIGDTRQQMLELELREATVEFGEKTIEAVYHDMEDEKMKNNLTAVLLRLIWNKVESITQRNR